MGLIDLISERRSFYALGKDVSVPKDDINLLVQSCVAQAPSAFNSQTSKAIILYDNSHNELWELLATKMQALLPPEAQAATLAKLAGFKAAYATVLFYENTEIVAALEQNMPTYAHNMQPWSYQASGMLQFAVWVGLKELGLGANLQHYGELVEQELYELYNIEKKYKLISQMPFGNILQPADEKLINNLQERFSICS